ITGYLFTQGIRMGSTSTPRIRHFSSRAKWLFASVCLLFSSIVIGQDAKQWLSAGHDINNTRNASSESKISPSTVGGLQVKWSFATGGDVSATPAADNQYIYFPDWAGNLYKVDATTG